MTDQLQVNSSTIRLMKGDITDFEIDAFVYYAQHDLVLGAGFGTAIAMRGGLSVQEELKDAKPLEENGYKKELAEVAVCRAVLTPKIRHQ